MTDLLPVESLACKKFIIRGFKVMLDRDLAELYVVSAKQLTEQMRRNLSRFPENFMFVLANQEIRNVRSLSIVSS